MARKAYEPLDIEMFRRSVSVFSTPLMHLQSRWFVEI